MDDAIVLEDDAVVGPPGVEAKTAEERGADGKPQRRQHAHRQWTTLGLNVTPWDQHTIERSSPNIDSGKYVIQRSPL